MNKIKATNFILGAIWPDVFASFGYLYNKAHFQSIVLQYFGPNETSRRIICRSTQASDGIEQIVSSQIVIS